MKGLHNDCKNTAAELELASAKHAEAAAEFARQSEGAASRHAAELREVTVRCVQQTAAGAAATESARAIQSELDFATAQTKRRTEDRDRLQERP